MSGIADFVFGGYPLPWNPVTMGEFVPAWFPLPQNPVRFVPDVNGSLPKAPPIYQSQLALTPANIEGQDFGCGGLGCAGGCKGGCGMAGLGDTIIPQASLPAFLQGDTYGIPTLYLAAGVVIFALAFMRSTGGGRRR